MADAEAAEFRVRWRGELVTVLVVWLLYAGVVAVVLIRDPGNLLYWIFGLGMMTGLSASAVRRARRRGEPWRVRVDPSGVSFFTHVSNEFAPLGPTHLPWASLVSVRRTSPPRWLRWLPGPSEALRLTDEAQVRFAARADTAPVEHLIRTRHLERPTDDVLAAIARFAPPEVRDRPHLADPDPTRSPRNPA